MGLFSHLHYNQPGPGYLFLLGPLYVLSGENSRSLWLSAFLLNGVSALATAWIARRLLGGLAGVAAVCLLGAYMAWLGLENLADSWMPGVIALPMLLYLVLAAGAAAGRRWMLIALLPLASYLLQVYTAVIPTVVGTLLVAIGLGLATRPGGSDRANVSRWWPWCMAAALLVSVAIWIPPAIALLTGSPGNASMMFRFLTTAHPELGPHVSLPSAVLGVLNQQAVFALGRPNANVVALHPARAVVAGLGLACAVFATAWGARKRQYAVRNMGALSITATLLAVLSTTRIQGDIGNAYVLWWSSLVLVPGIVGAVAAVGSALQGRTAPRAVWPVTAAVGVAVCLLVAGAFAAEAVAPADASIATAMTLIRPAVGPLRGRVIEVTTIDTGADPSAEGIVLQLEKAGATVHVDGGWAEKYSAPEAQTGGESVEILVALAGQKVPPRGTTGATDLGVVGPVEIWERPLTP